MTALKNNARTNYPLRILKTEPLSAEEQLAPLRGLGLPTFQSRLRNAGLQKGLRRTALDILQLNITRMCNQRCHHCHVDAGPHRDEHMKDAVLDRALELFEKSKVSLLDVTGGAPELHPRFEELIARASAAGKRVINRCNLTILTVEKYKHLPAFFAEHNVEIVSSLPFHEEGMTDRQRGDGVFDKSIRALRMLNDEGYGMPGSKRLLTLVTNPVGAFLPPDQDALETEFRVKLMSEFGVHFSNLISLTNMPVRRYLDWLQRSGNVQRYMQKLSASFNPSAAEGVMCRNTLSVGLKGELYDCDFNQMLEMPLAKNLPQNILDLAPNDLTPPDTAQGVLDDAPIVVDDHCYGCTAGAGSSCGGATA
ncbi:MAG: radical SAM/Cys-rich domain protein [Deltaproteobacteria bacterium]|nr:radical SAM/Cys-rich domain protein [Deltaproteobacteria bacterium]